MEEIKTNEIIKIIKDYMSIGGLNDRKITGNPTDSLSMINKQYMITFVTQNGTTAKRPSSPTKFQYYFDTTLGIPIWWNGVSWVNSVGGIV